MEDLAVLIWQETVAVRREAHASSGVLDRCPSRLAPYGPQDPHGVCLDSTCRDCGCLDLVHEVFCRCSAKLTAAVERAAAAPEERGVRRPAGYARLIVRNEVTEMVRAERVARGMPAKPSRSDGVAGRVNRALLARAGDDQTAGQWLVVLFRVMRSYVCRPGRTSGEWPLDALCSHKSACDGVLRVVGGCAARQELRADVDTVLAVAIAEAGHTWVYENLTGLLQRVAQPHPLGQGAHAFDALHLAAGGHFSEDEQLVPFLIAEYGQRRRRGGRAAVALEQAAVRVYGRAPSAQVCGSAVAHVHSRP